MNRCVALLLALLILMSFAACSGGSESKDNTQGSGSSATASSEEVASADKEEESSKTDESSDTEHEGVDALGDLTQYISLGVYDGIQMGDKAVLTEDIEKAVLNLNYLADYATLRDVGTERAAKMDDTVVIDFVGYYADSGEKVEGSSSNDQTVVLGSGTFIDGFEEAIVGKLAGEKFEVVLTYPEDYHYKEYAGVKARFEITLDSVKETVYPQPDAEIAKKLGYDSVEALLAAVKEEAEQSVYNQNVSDVWKAVLDGSTVVKYPDKSVKAYAKQYSDYYLGYYEYNATAAGVELEEYVSVVFGMTLDAFKADLNKTATEYGQATVKEELVMYAILDAVFGREISDEDYAAMLAEKSEELGITVEKLEEKYGEETLRINMYWDKVMIYVYEQAQFGAVTE